MAEVRGEDTGDGFGVQGTSFSAVGVVGAVSSERISKSGPVAPRVAQAGVLGSSDEHPGVYGGSGAFDAVVGETNSSQHAGVTGRNLTDGGAGIYGTGGQYAGKFDGNVLVNGSFTVDGDSVPTAIVASAATGVAVSASTDSGIAIVVKTSTGGGVYVTSESGAAITANADTGIAVSATSYSGVGLVGTSTNYDGIQGVTASDQNAGVSAVNNGAGPAIWAMAASGPAGFFNGDIRVTGDVILLNAGSGDVAEDFDLEDDIANAEPGTVLIIGVAGKLRASDQTYDSRVAGVVSGGCDLAPAVVLQRIPSVTRRAPVALVGTVFCKVDAGFGSIVAGDMLTTSATPGHAMKVGDRSQALGAVLGKALGPLEHGRGMVPVLVSLR